MLYPYILKLLLVAAPWLSQTSRESQAHAIAEAVGNDREAAVMLVATGAIETGFRERYRHCDCKPGECDQGAALSVFQLHWFWWGNHTRDEICSDNRLATQLAFRALLALRKGSTAREALRLYVGSKVSNTDARIVARFELWDRLVRL